ncbi:MAG: exo-alpha-sialidase [Verrucomicrobia bacterium]|nr:exo-alpha-sialidase [Verrucomicrobiota bacterium]
MGRATMQFMRAIISAIGFTFLGITAFGAQGVLALPVEVKLGAEQTVVRDAGWPYLFQAKEGTTVVFGHKVWLPKQHEPVVFASRSFDERKSWEVSQPTPGKDPGPVTEGSAVQLADGRILIFNVYAYHVGERRFEGKRWVSRDGWKTVSGPETIRVSVPLAKVDGMVDDRGEPISRLYLRRSVVVLAGGDLLATAYGCFDGDNVPVEYLPAMKQSRTYLIRSHDEGLTWNYAGTVAAPPMGQEGFGEPVLLRLQHGAHAGRLICQMRAGRENAISQSESDDDGTTWTPAHPLSWTFSRYGRSRDIVGVDPDLIEMSTGILVMGYGHKPDFMDDGNFLAFSVDQGKTWTAETRLSSAMTRAYVGVREVSPGKLFVVYTNTTEPDGAKYKEAVFDVVGRTVTVTTKTSAADHSP